MRDIQAVVSSEMEKGYDLPISDQDRNEAEQESDGIMGLLTDIYKHAEKGNSLISYTLFFSALFPCYENGRKAGNANFGFLIQTADHFR